MSDSRLPSGSLILWEEVGEVNRTYDPQYYRYVKASESLEASEQFLFLYKRMKCQQYVTVMEEKIKSLLKYYHKKKNYINRLLIDRIIRKELCLACFVNQLEDSCIVVEILKLVHEVFASSHMNILLHLIWNYAGNIPPINSLIIEDKRRRRKRTFSFLAYFLHHARVKRLTFHGRRLTDLFWFPLDYGVLRSGILSNSLLTYNSETVLLLLQHGAQFTGQVTNSTGSLPPLFFGELGRLLFCFHNADQWSPDNLELRVPLTQINHITKTMLENFKMFVLSTNNPSAVTFDVAGVQFRRWRIPEHPILVKFFDIFYPGMNFGRNQPCRLLHSCRHTIRQRLHENWQLPDGLSKLLLPPLLRNYLNFKDRC